MLKSISVSFRRWHTHGLVSPLVSLRRWGRGAEWTLDVGGGRDVGMRGMGTVVLKWIHPKRPNTDRQTGRQVDRHARTHAHTGTQARTHTHMNLHTQTHGHTRTHAHTHSHTHTHTHTRTHTRTHIYTLKEEEKQQQ